METHRGTWEPGQGWTTGWPDWAAHTDLVLAFGGRLETGVSDALVELRARCPEAVLTGCSTAGHIAGPAVFDDGLVVLLVRFARATVRAATAEIPDPSSSRAAGEALADALAGPALRHVFVLSDGLGVNGSDLAAGLRSKLPEVVVTGGLAADGPRFGSTWVLGEHGPRAGMARAIGLYGPITVGHGSRGGWEGFGVVRTVTRATDNVLYELDGRPALDLYEAYLGDRAAGLPATGLLFPLGLLDRHGAEVVRTILAVDREARSLTFAGDVPEGARVRLMRAELDRLVDAAADAAARANHSGATVALAVSCVGRRLVFGPRAEDEVEAVIASLPGCALIGMYSYGELSPTEDGTCDLHNQTMTLTTWSEGEAGA